MLWMRKIRLKTEGEKNRDISRRLMDLGNSDLFIKKGGKKNGTQQKEDSQSTTHKGGARTHTDIKWG